ncbi:MAG: flagellar export chaperone FliS [Gammaproteobacteria bacterium]|nr:flagellar export chaperone FliS [Gammaproteobacteria bacterium]
MHTTHGTALGQYRAVTAYGAASGDRLQLITRLMEGALDRITSARGHMARGEIAAKGEAIGRAIGLIDGLRTALDHERGGTIAANLDALYDYMMRRLVEANLRDDERRLTEVAGLLDEIRSAWASVTHSQATAGAGA